MALPKLTGKAKLKNDLEQLKVKVKRAQDDLNRTINGKSLKEADKSAYDIADQVFKDAIAARDAAQIALDNYKEPVKPAKPKSAKEIEAQRQKDLIEGKVGQALEDQEQADATATIESIGADFDAKIKDARQYIFDLKEKGRKELAQTLKDAGYEVVVDGSFPNDTLLNNYVNSLKAAKTQNDLNKDVVGYEPVNWSNYISSRISAAGGGGGSATDVGINISSDTDAEALIQSTFKSTLGREATANELASFKKQLNKAEKAAGRKTTKSGNRTVYTSDLNREQFLTNEIKKIVDPKSGKSEFETKRAEKEGLTAQSLRAVAKLNGINLTQDQLDAYATDIRNGKDINVIKNGIRQMAGLGRPDSIKKLLAEGTDLDTIYSPYKTTMASLLEVPEDQIDLNDSTLQSAIGPDKEMPLYEFRKALKKDNRWQYTKNAEKEVSDVVLRVLKDFGFQG
jgi:hypothetical protein